MCNPEMSMMDGKNKRRKIEPDPTIEVPDPYPEV